MLMLPGLLAACTAAAGAAGAELVAAVPGRAVVLICAVMLGMAVWTAGCGELVCRPGAGAGWLRMMRPGEPVTAVMVPAGTAAAACAGGPAMMAERVPGWPC